MPMKDVVVIGAGAAGLSAAKELSRHGCSYTVLEASHRVGGRAYSEELAPGVWFDLGCAWVGDGSDNPFIDIADELGIVLGKDKADCFKAENLGYQRDRRPLQQNERRACLDFCKHSHGAILAAARRGQDIPLSEVLDVEHEFAAPFLGDMASAWGLDVDGLSTADVASSQGGLGYPVLNGYGNLVASWGADVEVSLNAQVERVDWSGPGVTVHTGRGAVRARTVLCTVSTGILGAGEIEFEPRLPDWKTAAIENLPMGTENKMGVYFDTDVFGPEGRGYYSTWREDGSWAKVHANVLGLDTASVFVCGRHAIWLEKQGQQAGHDFAVDRVADVFGNGIRKHVSRSIVTSWTTDPWTRGSWACAKPGQAHQRASLRQAVDRRVFFAGEATMTGGQGTCHGAYRSGVRAAAEISEVLRGP